MIGHAQMLPAGRAEMDIKVADSVLAVVSFFAGTIVPVVYKRLAYDQISLRQPSDIRGVFQDADTLKQHQIIFFTVVKLANASKDCLIIDEIRADSVSTFAAGYECVGVDLKTSKPGEEIQLPPTGPALDFLPFLVKETSELIITLGLLIQVHSFWGGNHAAEPSGRFYEVNHWFRCDGSIPDKREVPGVSSPREAV
jgi:hypothetical protein